MNEHKNDIVKYCAYSLLLLALYVLQTARGTSLSLWGLQLDVIPFFVVTLALFEGPYGAGSLGFAAGLLCAVGSPVLDGLLALYYGVLGVLATVFKGVIGYLFYYALFFNAPAGRAALLLLGDCAVSLLPAALVFFIVRAIYLRFAEKDEA